MLKDNKCTCQVGIERSAVCRHVDTDTQSGARSQLGLSQQKDPEQWMCDDQQVEIMLPIPRAERSSGSTRHARSFAYSTAAVREETNRRYGCVSEQTQVIKLPLLTVSAGLYI